MAISVAHGRGYDTRMQERWKALGQTFESEPATALSSDRLAEIKRTQEGLTRRAEIAAASKAMALQPKAEVPYLPKGLESGRLGETMRASPKELEAIYEKMPETERPVEALRGTEKTFWSPGTKQEYGDLRTAMTGFRQRPAEDTAAKRLSAAIQGQTREQGLEDYSIRAEAMFKPYVVRGPEGEAITPAWVDELYSTGRAMAIEDPEGAIRHVDEVISKHERIQAEALDMSEEDLMSAAGLDPDTGVPVETSRVAETAEVPGMPRAPRARTGLSAAATRLRRQYESEQPSPIIGAETLGRFKKAWGRREESPYVRLGR